MMDVTEFAEKYEPFIASTARKWGIPGYDEDDKCGEIYHVLAKCAQGYDPASGVPFFFYFRSAVANHLGKVLTRQLARRTLLAEYCSLYVDDADTDNPKIRQIVDPRPGPDELAISSEFVDKLRTLSPVARAYIGQRAFGCTPPVKLTAAQRRSARTELRRELAGELSEWRDRLRVPVDDEGKRVRSLAKATRWARA
jgi:hypothetical protein